MLEITDDSGIPVTGSDGNPAVATISESAESASGGASVTLNVGTSQSLGTLVQMGRFDLLDGNSGCTNPGCRQPLSDWIDVLAGSTGLQVTMCSGACPGTIGFGPPHTIFETGQPQEIDVLPSPVGSGDLHVIVNSIDTVPEPSTAALLTAALGVLSAVRRPGTRAAA